MNNLNDNEETMSNLIKRKNEEAIYQELFYPMKSENKIFPDIKVPYRILFNSQNKEIIYQMVLDHLLFSCAKESLKVFVKKIGFLNNPDFESQTSFISKFRHIFLMVEKESEFENILKYLTNNFKLRTDTIEKFIDSLIKYYFLKMLLTNDSQETFNYFKQKFIRLKFKLDPEIFSLIGFKRCNAALFQKYVNQSTINSYKLRMKSILWESEYHRKESMAMAILDRWAISEM